TFPSLTRKRSPPAPRRSRRVASYLAMNRHTLAALTTVLCLIPAAVADTPDKDKWETPPALKGLKYRSVGPAAGGRVCRVCGVPGDPLTYYAATAGGGVWKSADGGLSFVPVFDDQPASSIGSVAVAPSD